MIWMLVGYLFLLIYRPLEVWPALGVLRVELFYMMGAGVIWLAAPNKRLTVNAPVLAVAGMVVAALLCALASPWVSDCLEVLDPWLKLQVFFLMLITLVRDEANLKRILAAWLVVTGLYMTHSMWEFLGGRYISRMGISRLVGVDQTNGDPNAFASTVLLSLVFVPVFWRSNPRSLIRCLLAGYVGLGVLCVMLTGSRTGFVGFLLFGTLTAWHSPWRKRMLVTLVLVAPLGFFALPPSLQQRFETIVNPSAGPANARESAEGRLQGFEVGMKLWSENLVTGVGPGAWKLASGRALNAHNLAGQLAGEMGTLGVTAFLGLLATYFWTGRRLLRLYRDRNWEPDLPYHVIHAIETGVALLLLSGVAGHNLFRMQWILYAAVLSIVHNLVTERARQEAEMPEFDYSHPAEFAGEPLPMAWAPGR